MSEQCHTLAVINKKTTMSEQAAHHLCYTVVSVPENRVLLAGVHVNGFDSDDCQNILYQLLRTEELPITVQESRCQCLRYSRSAVLLSRAPPASRVLPASPPPSYCPAPPPNTPVSMAYSLMTHHAPPHIAR